MGKIDDAHQSNRDRSQQYVAEEDKWRNRSQLWLRIVGVGLIFMNMLVLILIFNDLIWHNWFATYPSLSVLTILTSVLISGGVTLFISRRIYQDTTQNYSSHQEMVTNYRQRTIELQIAAEIARDVSSGTDPKQLLHHATHLIYTRFQFYHVAIFLIESLEDGDYAVLQSASGMTPASHNMVESGHKLRVGSKSIIGYVSEHGEPRIVLDVEIDSYHLANPNLPETRAEIAVPFTVEDQIIGVLDVQSREANAFSPENASVLRILADLLAVALHRAKLHLDTIKHAQTLERLVNERTIRLASERAQLIGILNGLREGVAYFQDHTIIYTNRTFDSLFGYSTEEWGRLPAALFASSQYAGVAGAHLLVRLRHEVMSEGVWQGELLLQRKNGAEFDGYITLVRMDHPGATEDIVMIARDISQEKAINEQQVRFVANASHELRTPLTNLQTRLYLLKRQPHLFDKHYDVLMTVIQQMQRLVGDLLETARFEQNSISLEFSTVNLNKIISNVIEFQQPEADKKVIQIVPYFPEEELFIQADQGRMIQIITNLVSNAVNYTEPHGKITVSLYANGSGSAEIKVTDTGIGIAPDKLDLIFEPFFRVDDSSSVGTGLGLSITKELVHLHGGEIDVHSTVGEGTTFTICCKLVNPDSGSQDSLSTI